MLVVLDDGVYLLTFQPRMFGYFGQEFQSK